MVSFSEMSAFPCYRTGLLTQPQAISFAACLRANRRFSDVRICRSSRTRLAACWFVTFAPSSTARQEALLRDQQNARAQRAATQSFTFAANHSEAYCFSHTSQAVYQLDPHGTWCDCEDSRRRCQPSGTLKCKHVLAWEASDEKREWDEARAHRVAEAKRFMEIFS
jgi:hypothetical protein